MDTLLGIVLAVSEEAEALADSLEHSVSTVSSVIEMVDEALRSCFLNSANETMSTDRDEVHKTIRGLKFSKLRVHKVYRTVP